MAKFTKKDRNRINQYIQNKKDAPIDILGVIQCRMGSTRLPGKSMMLLDGKPMIQVYIERVKRSKLKKIVLATTKKAEDDILVEVAKKLGIETFRGSENNLIKRIYECGVKFNALNVMRLCADNPLIEPDEINRLIYFFKSRQRSEILYSNTHNINNNGYPDGLGAEIYRMRDLDYMNRTVMSTKYKEHPHEYFFDTGMVETVKCPKNISYPKLKLDINTEAEYKYIGKIFDKFGHNAKASDYLKKVNKWR